MPTFVRQEDWAPSNGIHLEAAAEEVVKADTSMSVIAGPGSGKTELLAQRALYLLQTSHCRPPQRILAISFKRDAAKNLKDRVSRRCGPDQARRFDSYTFEAFAKSLVDRFLPLTPEWCRPSRDYQIFFPDRDDWEDFIRELNPSDALGGQIALRSLRRENIEKNGPLPLDVNTARRNIKSWTTIEWWRHCLHSTPPKITFPMLARLAESILIHNPEVVKALRLTYSHVFMDEFQDTTIRQYQLAKIAFQGSASVLTAVGDTNQRIMTWAGAEAEAFTWFERDFLAERKFLQMNHRSNTRIVQILNDLVQEIEPEAVETISARPNNEPPDDAAGLWIFDTEEEEAERVASFISEDISEHNDEGRNPNDFVLLVRIRANETEDRLREAFQQHGLQLRNEARLIGGIAIQDLMADELTLLSLGLIKLSLGVRTREVYLLVQQTMLAVLGTDPQDPRSVRRLETRIKGVLEVIKKRVTEPPESTDLQALINEIIIEVGETEIRRVFKQYEDENYFRQLKSSLAELIQQYIRDDIRWAQLIDEVEGIGQVRLMTVHKSKGLEYHTVIFIGLHQQSFWGYRTNPEEETKAFFVALSRARERVYFTRARQSGGVAEIRNLVNLLEAANVPIIEFHRNNE